MPDFTTIVTMVMDNALTYAAFIAAGAVISIIFWGIKKAIKAGR